MESVYRKTDCLSV